MTAGRALVLGGTGMLSGVAESLTRDGWHVVLPSRRYNPIAAVPSGPGVAARATLPGPGHRPDAGPDAARAIWVEADWSNPGALAEHAGAALGGQAGLLVAWIHWQHRQAVLRAVSGLLAAGAPVVEVLNAPSGPPEEPVLPEHPTQQVALGHVLEPGNSRWLTHAEIVHGVLAAVGRALDGRPSSLHHIGEPGPWPAGH